MKKLILTALILTFIGLFGSFGYAAGDLLVNNYSFESGLTGWKSTGQGIVVSSEQKQERNSSLKITNSGLQSSFVESDKITVQEGQSYFVFASTYILSGTAQVSIRYYDSANILLTTITNKSTDKFNKWSSIRVKGTAPKNAKYADIVLEVQNGTVYFDNILFTAEFTNLGPQISRANILNGEFGKDSIGTNLFYTVMSGKPAKFVVMDMDNNKLVRSFDLPYGTGAWAMTTASDGKVYAGMYNDSGGAAHLYQYTPGADSIRDLGQISSDTKDLFVWDITPGKNGEVYFGTYQNAKAFKYSPTEGFKQVGPSPFVPNEQYIRSIAIDKDKDILYAGIGSHAHLMRYDLRTGEIKDITPDKYKTSEFAYYIRIVGRKLFARFNPEGDAVVIDLDSGVVENTISKLDISSLSPEDPDAPGKLYYSIGSNLYYYDTNTKTVTSKGVRTGISQIKFGFIKYGNDNWLVGAGLAGRIFRYNPKTGEVKITTLTLPSEPAKLRSIARGNDGKIYNSGYLFGGIGGYRPMRSDENTQLDGINQAENMAAIGDKLYIGVYPGADIFEYNLATKAAPKFLFRAGQMQDRPFGMTVGEGKLFVGTVPDYGKLGGAFSIYDTKTGQYTIKDNIIPNQSIISLVYKNGKIYGGTTVSGGLGINPTENEAKLFIWDVNTGSKILETVPIKDKKSITALVVGPDGNIWGMDEGNLFIFDIGTQKVIYKANIILNANAYSMQDAALLVGRDGNVYGTCAGKFFKVYAKTKHVSLIKQVKFFSGYSARIEQDGYGNIYYTDLYNLYRYAF